MKLPGWLPIRETDALNLTISNKRERGASRLNILGSLIVVVI